MIKFLHRIIAVIPSISIAQYTQIGITSTTSWASVGGIVINNTDIKHQPIKKNLK